MLRELTELTVKRSADDHCGLAVRQAANKSIQVPDSTCVCSQEGQASRRGQE